ncbi:MAG: response regulator [Actinomycetota bacterium]|nr:response regulator [Actinomycetota bacterium]
MRVLLVDDHDSIRKSLRQLIELRAEFEVVGEGSNGSEALERTELLQPDIILMDMNMPVMDGVQATRVIKERYPKIQVLALTAFADMSLVSEMVKAGASGYLLKGGSSKELLDSLQAISRGQGALDKEVTRGVMEDMADLYRKEQERADALEELDRMKSEFVSVVSHELRTPMTSIKGGVATLQTNWGAIDDRVKLELLDSMGAECDRLSRMVSQILTASGIQRGGLGLRPTLFSVAVVAQAAVASLADKLEGREVSCNFEEIYSSGDEERLTEVIAALIENAIDFTEGRISVDVKSVLGTPLLSVSDEGPGIAPEALRRLLNEPFSQADSSSTRQVGGLGLSLYLARQVAEASGGRLEVDTAPDRGSTFTLILRPV